MINYINNISLSAHIFSTSCCNLSCNHCFINASVKNSNTTYIAAKNIIFLIKKIFEFNELSDIELEGGEILLHPEIKKIIVGIPANNISQLTITTNGTIPFDFSKILNSDMLSKLQLRVSIEGHTKFLHEKIRNSSLSKVSANLKQWAKMGINLIIRVTLNSYNYQYIQEIVNYVYLHNIKRVQFLEYQASGRGADLSNKHLLLNNDEYQKVLKSIIALEKPTSDFQISLGVSKNRIFFIEDILSDFTDCYDITEKKNINSLVINWDESIACCPWSSFEMKLGEIDYNNFLINLKQLTSEGLLKHNCDNCTRYSITSKEIISCE